MDAKKITTVILFLFVGTPIFLSPTDPDFKMTIPEHYKIEVFAYTRPPNDSTPLATGLIVYADTNSKFKKKLMLDVRGMTLREIYIKYNKGKVLRP